MSSSQRSSRVSGHVFLMKRKRGDKWYAKYRLPSGRQVQRCLGDAWKGKGRPLAGALTERTAREELEAILTDARRGEFTEQAQASGVTFGDALDTWLAYVEHEKARRPSTVKGYQGVGRILAGEFGRETSIEEITTEKIDAYRRRLLAEGKLTRRTIQQRLVLLHGLLRRAVAKGWISENPADKADRVNVPRSEEFNVLSVEQVEAIAAKAEIDLSLGEVAMFAVAITVAAFTGLRTGELRALRWRDVDFVGAQLTVWRNMPIGGEEGAPKSGRGRSVPLMDQAARVLDRLSQREHFTEPDDRVFCDEFGAMLSDDALRDALYSAMKAAGIDRKAFPAKGGFVFHDLRHTFGTLAAQTGASLVEIKAWMGHADITTTMIYAHYVPKLDAAARLTAGVEALSELAPSRAPTLT